MTVLPATGTSGPVDQLGGDFQHDRTELVRVVDLVEVEHAGRVRCLYPKTALKRAVRTMLIPVPRIPRGGQPPREGPIGGRALRDTELPTWCGDVIRSVLAGQAAA